MTVLNTRERIGSALGLLLVLIATQANGEVTKLAFPSDTGLDFVWWPKLTAPPSWEQDYDASVANAINILVPSGESFSDADTIIYARAIFRETEGTPPTLSKFVENDFASHKSFDPNLTIGDSPSLEIADGTDLESYTFFPQEDGSWERVAYGQDGQFYLLFVLSSRTQSGYEGALSDFESAVRSYVREPVDLSILSEGE